MKLLNLVKYFVFCNKTNLLYDCKAFHRFGQAKFPYGGLVLGSSQFSLLLQLPQKMTLNIKVV
jgi:hypothetical protein